MRWSKREKVGGGGRIPIGRVLENARMKGVRLRHWDILSRRLAELEVEEGTGLGVTGGGCSNKEEKMVTLDRSELPLLPIAAPLARLVDRDSPNAINNYIDACHLRDQWTESSITMHDALESARLRRERGEEEVKDRVWRSMVEMMRRAALLERKLTERVLDGSKEVVEDYAHLVERLELRPRALSLERRMTDHEKAEKR